MSPMRSLIILLAILCLFGIAGRMDYQDQMEMQAMAKDVATAETSKNRGKTKMARCECAHQYQDEQYGKGLRVHNIGAKDMSCTVCGNSK